MTNRVQLLDEIVWPFGSPPHLDIAAGGWHHHERVDPFPCYHHEIADVIDTLGIIEAKVDIAHKPYIYVLSYDTDARTNGWATYQTDYDAEYDQEKDKNRPWVGQIVMPGKRIPLHPAMTRYLTAHEYGHIFEYNLLDRRGKEIHDSSIREEYGRLRGAPPVPYGGRNWHKTASELLANDFRVLVCGIETEFWPHKGFPDPRGRSTIEGWWDKVLAEIAEPVATVD